ncbi:putative immunity protein [Rathayibacter sp. AY1E8]|uniref:putative immunity protein n=1 Tax=Rathayibacter sp. AY1E8 TaxID=2080555 RepID=UPI0035BE4865
MSGAEEPAWADPEPEVHRALARWAAECAERALPAFEERDPDNARPRRALDVLLAWGRGEAPMTECRAAAFTAHAAARAATQAGEPAAAVAHMVDHCSHAAVESSAQPRAFTRRSAQRIVALTESARCADALPAIFSRR